MEVCQEVRGLVAVVQRPTSGLLVVNAIGAAARRSLVHAQGSTLTLLGCSWREEVEILISCIIACLRRLSLLSTLILC